MADLPTRQREVLDLMDDGGATRTDMADELGIAKSTVESHQTALEERGYELTLEREGHTYVWHVTDRPHDDTETDTGTDTDDTGAFEDPAFYQAPVRSAAGLYTSVSESDVQPLSEDELLIMRWPGSHRSDRVYPLPPALQLKEWLELIADSTTHLSRYYSDDELPAGMLTAREASQQDLDSIRDELQAAKGDPRSAPVVGTDARWVEVGGSAVDLSHIEEQKWFLQLCMAAFGVPKTEMGMDDQVNYSTSESELQVIAKRITSKLSRTIGKALERQLLPQFDLYQRLDQPFGVDLRYSDPREERIEEQRALDKYSEGAITYRELRERLGDDMADEDTTVVVNGQEIDYGSYPKPVVDTLLRDARNDPEPPAPDN